MKLKIFFDDFALRKTRHHSLFQDNVAEKDLFDLTNRPPSRGKSVLEVPTNVLHRVKC